MTKTGNMKNMKTNYKYFKNNNIIVNNTKITLAQCEPATVISNDIHTCTFCNRDGAAKENLNSALFIGNMSINPAGCPLMYTHWVLI